jgi:hypothetical protein
MPLTADRDTKDRNGVTFNAGVAAATKIYTGALVARNASGYLVPGSEAATLKKAGRAKATVDNSDGSAGDLSCEYEVGCFKYKNSASTDAITIADIGNDCYIVDDETVAKTSDEDARSVAGQIVDVDAGGVWVLFR